MTKTEHWHLAESNVKWRARRQKANSMRRKKSHSILFLYFHCAYFDCDFFYVFLWDVKTKIVITNNFLIFIPNTFYKAFKVEKHYWTWILSFLCLFLVDDRRRSSGRRSEDPRRHTLGTEMMHYANQGGNMQRSLDLEVRTQDVLNIF